MRKTTRGSRAAPAPSSAPFAILHPSSPAPSSPPFPSSIALLCAPQALGLGSVAESEIGLRFSERTFCGAAERRRRKGTVITGPQTCHGCFRGRGDTVIARASPGDTAGPGSGTSRGRRHRRDAASGSSPGDAPAWNCCGRAKRPSPNCSFSSCVRYASPAGRAGRKQQRFQNKSITTSPAHSRLKVFPSNPTVCTWRISFESNGRFVLLFSSRECTPGSNQHWENPFAEHLLRPHSQNRHASKHAPSARKPDGSKGASAHGETRNTTHRVTQPLHKG